MYEYKNEPLEPTMTGKEETQYSVADIVTKRHSLEKSQLNIDLALGTLEYYAKYPKIKKLLEEATALAEEEISKLKKLEEAQYNKKKGLRI